MNFSGLTLALFLAGSSCASGDPAGPAKAVGGAYSVLFIGNSLTYFNDLPGTVVQLGRLVDDTVHVRSVAEPNLALIDHVNGKSDALGQIQSQPWDYVVLQQGPSALPASRDTLILATRMLDPEIRGAGGRSALLMIWPELSRFTLFDEVRDSYLLAAQDVDGVFLPAGEAWRTAWAKDPALKLYGPDGYHPAPLGTYLAALVVYEGVTGHDARLLPDEAVAAGQPLALPRSTVQLLQEAAHQTVERFR